MTTRRQVLKSTLTVTAVGFSPMPLALLIAAPVQYTEWKTETFWIPEGWQITEEALEDLCRSQAHCLARYEDYPDLYNYAKGEGWDEIEIDIQTAVVPGLGKANTAYILSWRIAKP